jgi:hypothetical protein
MKQKYLKYIYENFAKLVEKYGFVKSMELNEEGAYSIEYSNAAFMIKLEKYFMEFYVALYKTGTDKGVNLFNLLNYLNKDSSDISESNYFKEEKDLEECYKKQFNYIVDTIDKNFVLINDFFTSGEYE